MQIGRYIGHGARLFHGRVLEVCCADIESVKAAVSGGADRIELCSALGTDGVTPSYGLIKAALKASGSMPVNVLIREREGDFVYTDAEIEVMAEDILNCADMGANGVVIGALTPEGDIDLNAMQKLMQAAEGLQVTFHRAFDVCRDRTKALEQIIQLGCHRILTSGGATNIVEGCQVLKRLVDQAADRIIILAGGGLAIGNAGNTARLTGVTELHGSCREPGSLFTSAEIVNRIKTELTD